jgi:hypothetical protein
MRFIALGASNLSRGFDAVVSTVRISYGPEVEILAAHGHGRSYGAHSRVLFRTLPGILQSGLWSKLESMSPAPAQALITDIGNDILYGCSADQILNWIEEAIRRLQSMTQRITITDLPTHGIRRLSNAKFIAIRSAFYPYCRLSLAEALERVERVSAGIEKLASDRSLRFFRMNPEWYGFDPVHIQLSRRWIAWPEILGLDPEKPSIPLLENLKLRSFTPERRWLFGMERFVQQTGISLAGGGRLWLY